MKVLVTYHSNTGNTEKLARAIYDAVEEADKKLVPMKDVEALDDFDLLFCGFPVQACSVPPKAGSFLKQVPPGKSVAIFATHGSFRGGQLAITAFYEALTLVSKDRVIGTFGCRGKVKMSLLDDLSKKPEFKGWVAEARSVVQHPDDADLHDAGNFAKMMMAKARAL